ncbi:MAG: alpha/beta hydrolase [Candidatus Kariarchaeaceae archaeon]|jgi:predicted alpha/beta superfamily hydrolase
MKFGIFRLVAILLIIGFTPTMSILPNGVGAETYTSLVDIEETYNSTNIGSSRKIFINLPASYDEAENKEYPVIYVVDANIWFSTAKETVEELVQKGDMPEVIIVGIGYVSLNMNNQLRYQDLFYPADPNFMENSNNELDALIRLTSGGGDRFYKFIEEELVPHIDGKYNTLDDRTLIGWSAGGYFTLYSMFQYRPPEPLFSNYISITPASWYKDFHLLELDAAMYEAIDNTLPVKLYMSIGDADIEGISIGQFHMDGFYDLVDLFDSRNYNRFSYKTKEYQDKGHSDIYVPSLQEGFKWIYDKQDSPLINYLIYGSLGFFLIATIFIAKKKWIK